MSKYLTMETLKPLTFDEAFDKIRDNRYPQTMGEIEGKPHLKVTEFYRSEAKKEGKKFVWKGLYFFITKSGEIKNIGKASNNKLYKRIYAHRHAVWYNQCSVSIVSFSETSWDNHLGFFEMLFIALCNPEPEGNTMMVKWDYNYLREKKLTIREVMSLRPQGDKY